MRASVAAVLVILLLAPAYTAVAHGGHVAHRTATGSMWWAERFSATGGSVFVDLESSIGGEVLAHTILLFDATTGKKISGGFTTVYPGPGSPAGNRADVALAASGVGASSDKPPAGAPLAFGSAARDPITFTCGGSCSGEYVLVVMSASDNMTSTGFAFTASGATLLANASGTDAHALTGRMFEGSVAHAVSEIGGVGASIAQATHATSISGKLIGAYFSAGTGAGTLTADTPAGRRTCGCAFTTSGVPGAYTFRLDDTNVDPDEAYLAYADVHFP